MKNYFIYIMASYHKTLYIGVTNDLLKRVFQHKNEAVPGFTQKYNCSKLVYCEQVNDINEAIPREKRLKKWNLEWKVQLIEKNNPNWNDLYLELIDSRSSRE